MGVEITNPGSQSADAIEAELKGLGLFFTPLDVPPVENTSHWHDFSSVFYITEGSVRLTDVESGTVHEAGPGSRISVPAKALHHEYSAEGYKILLGTTKDPATFTGDVNLPPEDLPA